MYRIGDFAKLSRVTVRTLRYYEEMGLLKPVTIDRWTGYRYYEAAQLPHLNRILALKDLGFSLDQIQTLMHEDMSFGALVGMLELKRAELQSQVLEAGERLIRVESRLAQIKEERTMTEYEILTKSVDAQKVAIVHDKIGSREEINSTFNRLFDEVISHVQQHNAWGGVPLDLWYSMGDEQDSDMQVAAAVPISRSLPETERVRVEELPAVEHMAYVVHHGSFSSLGQAYGSIMEWLKANNYSVTGPSREVYLEYDRNGDPAKYVTEIQFPVERS